MIFTIGVRLLSCANKLGLAAAVITARLQKRLDGATNTHGKA
jgi:hypothetical protein